MNGNLSYFLPMLRVGIAESLKKIALVDCEGNASGSLDSAVMKELLHPLHSLFVDDNQISVRLEVNLVDFDLLGDLLPSRFEPAEISHFAYFIRSCVNGNFEVLHGGTTGYEAD
jgi:hypothetical protein